MPIKYLWTIGIRISIEFIEEFKILLMNRSNSVLGIFPVSKGGLSGTVTDVRLIYQAAIKANASGIICMPQSSFWKSKSM